MASGYSDALESIFGKPGEWTYSNADNEPDAEFDERWARKRVKELKRLTRLADEAGYCFDEDYGPTPRQEIHDLESRLFVGPRPLRLVVPPSELTEKMLDSVFTSSRVFSTLFRDH